MSTLYNEMLLAKIKPKTLKESDTVYIIGKNWFDIAHIIIDPSGIQCCQGTYGHYTFKNGKARSSDFGNTYCNASSVYGIVPETIPETALEPMLCPKAISSNAESEWKMIVQKITPKDILVEDFHIDDDDSIVQITYVQYNATTSLYTIEFWDNYGGGHNEMIYQADEQLTIVRLCLLGG